MSAFGGNFADYAKAQHDLGVEQARRHAPEETGCCRTCGRVFPCDGFENGQHMQAHFGSWLGEEPSPGEPAAGWAVVDPSVGAEPRLGPELRFGR